MFSQFCVQTEKKKTLLTPHVSTQSPSRMIHSAEQILILLSVNESGVNEQIQALTTILTTGVATTSAAKTSVKSGARATRIMS